MIINPQLIHASMNRWRSKKTPQEVATHLGEGERKATPAQRQQRYSAILSETRDPERARLRLERILQGNDLTGINYLALGTLCARSVCRIHLRDTSGNTVGFGTGFLVAPGTLLTNHHVIANKDEARLSTAEFNYEYDLQGNDKPVLSFPFLTNPGTLSLAELDFCLVGVAPQSVDGRGSLDSFGWLPLGSARGKGIIGEYLTIIQHPGGERKQVCVRENKLIKYDETGTTVWYMTDTVAGSSGSPVFNGAWQVVALHHMGVPKTDRDGNWLTTDGSRWDPSMDESLVDWEANEGVRISSIIEYLQARSSDHPLAANVLAHINQSIPSLARSPIEASSLTPQPTGKDGEFRLTIPVQVAVRVSMPGFEPVASPTPVQSLPSQAPPAVIVPAGIEKVKVDQSNYSKRPGYNPKFLGDNALLVPRPIVKKGTILEWGPGTKKQRELKYWNYSVVMNKDRKLAFFSAVNVDANLRPADAGRDGDVWYFDTRPPQYKDYELGPEFYGAQSEFEVDRAKNPFDRGHLTRRLDAQWGNDDSDAKRNGDDSFHWTNCSPQHWRYNQGSKRWLGLEDYVIKGFASATKKACVINGPVFDAPLSTFGPDGRPVPSLKAKAHPDPTFGSVAIPKLFFKVVACQRAGGKLAAAAFLMSQEDLLRTVDRIKNMPAPPEEILTAAEAKLYQVRLADLARLVQLDFGPLPSADAFESLNETASIPKLIGDLDGIHLS